MFASQSCLRVHEILSAAGLAMLYKRAKLPQIEVRLYVFGSKSAKLPEVTVYRCNKEGFLKVCSTCSLLKVHLL